MLNLGYKVSWTVWPPQSSRAWDQTTGALHAGGMNWEPIHGSHWLSSFSIHNLNQIHVVVLSSDHWSQTHIWGANWITFLLEVEAPMWKVSVKLDQISSFRRRSKSQKTCSWNVTAILTIHATPTKQPMLKLYSEASMWQEAHDHVTTPNPLPKVNHPHPNPPLYLREVPRCQFQLQFHGLPGTCGVQGELQISLTLVLKGFSKRTPSILGFLGSPAYLIWLQWTYNVWSEHQKMISRTFVLPPGHHPPKTDISPEKWWLEDNPFLSWLAGLFFKLFCCC